MYEQFYNLRERPFSLSPDPDYLYLSRVHTEALSHLRYGIEGHAGFVVITGEIGSGKTTLLQTAMRGLDSRTSVARLVNTMLDARELVEAVMLDFGLDPQPGQSKPHLLRDLARFLVEQRKAERLPLLIIDEAQNLSKAALEEVRMLSNLETEKSKLIQIILVGQPDLYDVLARPEFEQLRQRVTVRYHLRSLDQDEAAAYINHRLRKAAIGAPLVFSKEVTDLIGEASQGLPRKINVISDAVLLFGYGDDKHAVDAPLVREVIGELAASGVLGPTSPRSSAPVAEPPVVEAFRAATTRAAADADAVAKERELAAREAALVERERDLAEQRRVVAEQSQLLKRQMNLTPAVPTQAAIWPPPAPVQVAPVSPALSNRPLFATEPTRIRRSLWTRLARMLFGSTKPVFEE